MYYSEGYQMKKHGALQSEITLITAKKLVKRIDEETDKPVPDIDLIEALSIALREIGRIAVSFKAFENINSLNGIQFDVDKEEPLDNKN
jgi:uncharacterized protein YehS (DUF1456 family)